MARRQLLFAVLFWISVPANAQDSLFYTNGTFVVGQVEEIGLEMVRYRTWSGSNPVSVVVEKRDLSRIKLQGGQEYLYHNTVVDSTPSPEFLARKHALSFDFIAPATNHFTVGYEQAIGTRVAITARLGYIGLYRTREYSYYNDPDPMIRGGLLKLGIKFILPPSPRRLPTARDEHPLAGWYLRPELLLSAWQQDEYYYDPYGGEQYKAEYASAAFNMVVGRQVILGRKFTFDLYGGIGYGMQWRDGILGPSNGYNNYRAEYSYSHIFVGSRTPLTISGGMAFGFLF